MHIVLWDTRHGGAFKDFAGGYGVGTFRGNDLRGKIIERFYTTDFRSPPLAYGLIAGGLRAKGHTVEYALDDMPAADVYIFNPALMTLPHELEVMRGLKQARPNAKLIVCGQVASSMPESFADVDVKVAHGEPEQLIPKLDEVLEATEQRVAIGNVANLDDLPFADWDGFPHRRFKVGYDFWKFPTGYIQSSRGCTLSCSYCPYIILENKVRIRSAQHVGDELRHGIKRYGFRSYKFRDPLWGARKKHVAELIDQIGRLPRKIQFSIETRIELLPRELLVALRDVGLTSITVGIESPSRETLLRYKRAPIKDDKQSNFVGMCRELGIRVVAGFIIGFPEDTRESIHDVLRYAKQVNPFAANFNVCTPYPGTGFYEEMAPHIATRDWSRYDVYTPNLKYQNLTPEEVRMLHQKCFKQFYFRWKYLANWQFMFPRLHQFVSWFMPTKAVTHRDDATVPAGESCASSEPKLIALQSTKKAA